MSDKIYNHLTGRFIQRYGLAHRKLLKEGLTQENNSNMKRKVKTEPNNEKVKSLKKPLASNKVVRKIEVSSDNLSSRCSNKMRASDEDKYENHNDENNEDIEEKIQEILNGLTKKQIQKMNDAQLTTYIQKKYVEECRGKRVNISNQDETESDCESDCESHCENDCESE